jgi:4-amino-4-deoxy-L-arabinose transferase-like glycosyltransferase
VGGSLIVRRPTLTLHTGIVLAAAFFAVFAAIAIGFSAPPFNSGDEAAHFDYAVTVWHGHLPVFLDGLQIDPPFGQIPPAQWVSQHPPLFYAVLAPVVGPLWDSGQQYHAVLAGRAVNAVIAGLTVLAVGWAARRVVPTRPGAASIAAVIVSLTSMFLLVGGAVYNDLPNVAFGAVAIGIGATALRRGLSTRLVVLAAVVTAAGMLSRLTFAVFLLAVLVAFVCARAAGWWNGLVGKAVAVVVAAAAPALAAGWFFLRNERLTGNIAGSQPVWAAEHLHRRPQGFVATVTDPEFWTGVFSVFRGHYTVDVLWPWALLLAPLLLAVVVAVVPVLRRNGRVHVPTGPSGRRRHPHATDPDATDRVADVLVALMLLAVVALVVFLQIRFTMQGGGVHARYALPVVPVLAVVMAIGLSGFGRFVSPLLVTVWVVAAGIDWSAIVDLSAPAFHEHATLTISRIAVVLAVVALAAVLTLVWTAALRRPAVLRRPDAGDEAAADEAAVAA